MHARALPGASEQRIARDPAGVIGKQSGPQG